MNFKNFNLAQFFTFKSYFLPKNLDFLIKVNFVWVQKSWLYNKVSTIIRLDGSELIFIFYQKSLKKFWVI